MTTSPTDRPLKFVFFTSFTPSGLPGMPWDLPNSRTFDYRSVDEWVRLAQALEEVKFDGLFWADQTAPHATYKQSWAPTVRSAAQFPILDPAILVAALAMKTTQLGLIFSANVIQDHPYSFARRLTSLDDVTGGRIGWNIVTSFLKAAWQNMGYDDVGKHVNRYERADEFVDVLYKLLEGSWEDSAVARDVASRIYAHPERIHEIGHKGQYYSVPGIHTSEPSIQRLPFLFQAGSSEDGRTFSARNAEAIFFTAFNTKGLRAIVSDMDRRLVEAGRKPTDMLYFAHRNYVLASTEEEAQRKDRELQDLMRESESVMTFMSSTMGVDFNEIDIDTPIGDFDTNALQGQFRALAEAAPDKRATFRDVAMYLTANRFVGTPEQAADELEERREAGVNGIVVSLMEGTGGAIDLLREAAPIWQKRGLMQTEYADGTLREKLFAGRMDDVGPRLNARHPAAQYRHG